MNVIQGLSLQANPDQQNEVIVLQNDLFRRTWPMAVLPGRFVLAPCVSAHSGSFQKACLDRVRSFDNFLSETDLKGLHEKGEFEVDSEVVVFEITDERYDQHEGVQENSADILCNRILTIRLKASEDNLT